MTRTHHLVISGPQPLIAEAAREFAALGPQPAITIENRVVEDASGDPRQKFNQFPISELVIGISVHLISATVYDLVKAKISELSADKSLKVVESQEDEKRETVTRTDK